MSSTTTPRFGLYKATPSSAEPVTSGISLWANMDTIDANLGCFVCTSSTRPTGITGRTIYETDTGAARVYDGTKWRLINTIQGEALTANSENTSSTSYTDLATVGPAVTLYMMPNQRAQVFTKARQIGNPAASAIHLYAVSGVETVAATSITAGHEAENLNASGDLTVSNFSTFTANGVEGNRTFTMKYKAGSAALANFRNRYMCVILLSN